MSKHNKAFTLTELLVVVIVIGVLAAVAVPKMKQMLETRKTTEAENVLSAVRTEQEHRCMLGKPYATQKEQLTMLSSVRDGNYRYQIDNETGRISAEGVDYKLYMPSYKTGEICCSGSGCASLNKAYAACTEAVPDECDPNSVAGFPSVTPPLPPENSCPEDTGLYPGKAYGFCECGGTLGYWYCGSETGWTWQHTDPRCDECSEPEPEHSCPESAGDPRTQWYEEAGRCGCPNGEVYYNGSCCSSARKGDTACWKRPPAWGPMSDKTRQNILVDRSSYSYKGDPCDQSAAGEYLSPENIYNCNSASCTAEWDIGNKCMRYCDRGAASYPNPNQALYHEVRYGVATCTAELGTLGGEGSSPRFDPTGTPFGS